MPPWPDDCTTSPVPHLTVGRRRSHRTPGVLCAPTPCLRARGACPTRTPCPRASPTTTYSPTPVGRTCARLAHGRCRACRPLPSGYGAGSSSRTMRAPHLRCLRGLVSAGACTRVRSGGGRGRACLQATSKNSPPTSAAASAKMAGRCTGRRSGVAPRRSDTSWSTCSSTHPRGSGRAAWRRAGRSTSCPSVPSTPAPAHGR